MNNIRKNDPVNVAVMENEKESTDWSLNKLATELYWWADFLNIAFFKEEPVPVPALSFENSSYRVLGHFVPGRNAFGFKNNININKRHLSLPLWETLSTLLHEMCHAWEYTYLDEKHRTQNWYHKKRFRDKLLSFGIKCNTKGQDVEYNLSGLFVSLLSQHAVDFSMPTHSESTDDSNETMQMESKPKPKGRSTLKKWECSCTVIRVGKKEFSAKCLKCGEKFQLAG